MLEASPMTMCARGALGESRKYMAYQTASKRSPKPKVFKDTRSRGYHWAAKTPYGKQYLVTYHATWEHAMQQVARWYELQWYRQ